VTHLGRREWSSKIEPVARGKFSEGFYDEGAVKYGGGSQRAGRRNHLRSILPCGEALPSAVLPRGVTEHRHSCGQREKRIFRGWKK